MEIGRAMRCSSGVDRADVEKVFREHAADRSRPLRPCEKRWERDRCKPWRTARQLQSVQGPHDEKLVKRAIRDAVRHCRTAHGIASVREVREAVERVGR